MAIQEKMEEFKRSGFWRRLTAFVIDAACILLPLQILVTVLYAQTGGYIQGDFGLTTTSCTPLSALPPGLQTQISNPTHAQDCRTSLFGFDSSSLLVVSSVETSETSTTTISESFWLKPDGQLADQPGYNVTWVAVLALFIYFVAAEASYGMTLGKKAMGLRTIRVLAPQTRGIGWGRAIARRFAWQIGGIPFMLTQIPMIWPGNDADAVARVINSPAYLVAGIVSLVIMAAWLAWLAISMARKRDAVYDRLVGTAVIRTRP